MMRILRLLFLFFLPAYLSAQSGNLLLNPGFEETDSSGTVKDWFLPMSSNYHHDKEGRYGPPHSGEYKAGICISNYRFSEAMQTLLRDTLHKGETYLIRFYARARPRTEDCYHYFAADEIQVYFPEEPVPALPVNPYRVNESRLVRFDLTAQDSSQRKEWQLFEGSYTAHGGERLMAVGYFMRKDSSKPLTMKAIPPKNKEKKKKRKRKGEMAHPIGAYYTEADEAFRIRYYFDDFELIKEDTAALPERKPEAEPRDGSVWVFHNIHFRFDRADLMPSAFPVLDSLAEILKQYPQLEVEIRAHTDSIGSESYNIRLSEKRAASVRNYLIGKGIESTRLSAAGRGENEAIADNGTEEGRARNRRVEFVFRKR